MNRVFLDTNVLVYAIDPQDRAKQSKSFEVQRVLRGADAVISTQVLSEFANVAIGKLAADVARDRARVEVGRLAESWRVVVVSPRVVELAIDGVERFGFAFYDAQIWAAARIAGCSIVLSEDFTDGFEADGVRFVDPFREGFDPATLTA